MRKSHLLILTYEMDESSQLFSHQISVVNELAAYFDKVTVITGKSGKFKVLDNVNVYSSNWQTGKRIKSIFRFLLIFFKLLFKEKFTVVFSHMTSVQAAFISPFTWIFRIKHFLWYTHTSDNFALRICSVFSNGILTATSGSCPIKGRKVYVIGHSIDSEVFRKKSNISFPIMKFVHVGRFDPSKNLKLIIDSIRNLRLQGRNFTLTTIGSPSSQEAVTYHSEVLSENRQNKDWLSFLPAIQRSNLPLVLSEFDCFIHAFEGSLDKAVLEATLVGLPVVTTNLEYLKIFGSWNRKNVSMESSLQNELELLLGLSKTELALELERRYEIALKDYEIKGWAQRVNKILNNSKRD